MNDELEPVGDHELVLRRVSVNHYNVNLPVPIQRAAFSSESKRRHGNLRVPRAIRHITLAMCFSP